MVLIRGVGVNPTAEPNSRAPEGLFDAGRQPGDFNNAGVCVWCRVLLSSCVVCDGWYEKDMRWI